jgi:hypothetical protein
MSARLQPGFDHVVRHPLFGVQCRDAVDGRVVADGLRVRLHDRWRPGGWTADLAANRSGVFALHAAPGLHGFDAAGAAVPGPPSEPARWRLEIEDTRGRYLPVAAEPTLPLDDLFGVGAGAAPTSPPDALPFVPLYSAPTRPLPAAMQALHVELRRAADVEAPAAWTRLELWLGTQRLAEGLAGADGQALLVFPMPKPREVPLGVSPAAAGDRFEWSVELRAFRAAAIAVPEAVLPTLAALLAQPPAVLLDAVSPPMPAAPFALRAGVPLVARGATAPYLTVAD